MRRNPSLPAPVLAQQSALAAQQRIAEREFQRIARLGTEGIADSIVRQSRAEHRHATTPDRESVMAVRLRGGVRRPSGMSAEEWRSAIPRALRGSKRKGVALDELAQEFADAGVIRDAYQDTLLDYLNKAYDDAHSRAHLPDEKTLRREARKLVDRRARRTARELVESARAQAEIMCRVGGGDVRANPVMAAPPQFLTAAQINRELDRLERESSRISDKMISAGRGSERPSEYLMKSDALSRRAAQNYERRMDLRAEITARYGPGAPSRLPRGRGFGPRQMNPPMLILGNPPREAWVLSPSKGYAPMFLGTLEEATVEAEALLARTGSKDVVIFRAPRGRVGGLEKVATIKRKKNPAPEWLARFGAEALSGAAFGVGAGVTERLLWKRWDKEERKKNPRMEITFKTSKKGRVRAYYRQGEWSWLPMALSEAQRRIASGEADFTPLHKVTLPPGGYRVMPRNPEKIVGTGDGPVHGSGPPAIYPLPAENPLTDAEAAKLEEDAFDFDRLSRQESMPRDAANWLRGQAEASRNIANYYGPKGGSLGRWKRARNPLNLREQAELRRRVEAHAKAARRAADPWSQGYQRGGADEAEEIARMYGLPVNPPSKKAQKWISRKIRKLRREGYPAPQAAAIAYSMARGAGFRSVPGRKRKANPAHPALPEAIMRDPRFRRELAAYRRRHGKGPVVVHRVMVPDGYPKFMSSWGEAPAVLYDASPSASKKGKRIHHFGEGRGKGKRPHLVSSSEKGPKFLAYVGGNYRADGEWILH